MSSPDNLRSFMNNLPGFFLSSSCSVMVFLFRAVGLLDRSHCREHLLPFGNATDQYCMLRLLDNHAAGNAGENNAAGTIRRKRVMFRHAGQPIEASE